MNKKEAFFILLILVCSIPSVLPLSHHGFFQTDDGEWMIIRLSAFYQALHDGQFPVRFLQRLNFNYGYPVGEFLYPGSFYLASLLHVIRFGFVNSIKIVYGISFIGSAIFTYLWLKKYFSSLASLVGSIFALYLPYHLYDVYKRGSVGEVFALLWIPFIFWQIERKSFLYSTIGIASLIISHNTLAALFMPLIICYMILKIFISKKRLQTLYFFSSILLCSLGLSAFFWIPAILELHYTVFSTTVVSQFTSYFATLDQIGYVTFLVLITILVLFIFKKADIKKHRLTLLLSIFSIISVVFATQISTILWEIIPVSFIQFPFRFLSILVVTIPFLTAFIVSVLKNKIQWTAITFLLVLLAYSAFPYSKPVSYFDKGEGYYYTNDATTTVQDEYMPIWVKQKPLKSPEQKILFVNGTGSINNIIQTSNSLLFTSKSDKPVIIQINTVYWPGWQANVDNIKASIEYNNPQGAIQVTVPKGTNSVYLYFGEDQLRLFADMLSLLFIIVLVVCCKKFRSVT